MVWRLPAVGQRDADQTAIQSIENHHALGNVCHHRGRCRRDPRPVLNQEGELSAAIELRRRFPGVTDNAKARACARRIAGWTPLSVPLRPVTRLHPRKNS